ncbi:predicted protein [Thalassiosira pseudonana CCMP1335]|uniref:25S rRNA (uridine-N(3))-methyltransferase BMT5-like domain-containing protein n=1 Tax=Thalassiosira pseudonana TaxID=35128 RepID=B8C9N9_THAPS|nr:predicted protein [Thalassiosira pseudonana CCMP1335]EED90076.1 predicted protein [Thalassiosira pseudonana CCMP1335]
MPPPQLKDATDTSDPLPQATPAWPHRNLDRLYCQTITHHCALGKTTSGPAGGSSAASTKPCIPCVYKIGNFDIAQDAEFTRRVANQRPEMCPRSKYTSTSNDEVIGENHHASSIMGYQRGMNVLTVGDGDFTFSQAVARLVVDNTSKRGTKGMVVATSYEERDTLRKVYPDFDTTLDALQSFGVVVGYNVDATRLNETLPRQLVNTIKYQRICWNFPCTAIGDGKDGQNDAMDQNKELVRLFITNALPYLDKECGEIHMAHKTKPPYNQWGLEKVALEGVERAKGGESDTTRREFEYKGRVVFDKCSLPPYTPRKALDRKSFPCHDACVYIFGWATSKTSDRDVTSTSTHTTIPENDGSDKSDHQSTQPAVIPVTESMIDELRTVHLQYAEAIAQVSNQLPSSGRKNKRRKF